MNATLNTITVRPATVADAPMLQRLAELDSAPSLSGDVLLAETRGRPVAALAADGRAVADPFLHSAEAVALLRTRAAQLRAHDGRRRRTALRPLLAR